MSVRNGDPKKDKKGVKDTTREPASKVVGKAGQKSGGQDRVKERVTVAQFLEAVETLSAQGTEDLDLSASVEDILGELSAEQMDLLSRCRIKSDGGFIVITVMNEKDTVDVMMAFGEHELICIEEPPLTAEDINLYKNDLYEMVPAKTIEHYVRALNNDSLCIGGLEMIPNEKQLLDAVSALGSDAINELRNELNQIAEKSQYESVRKAAREKIERND